MAGRGLNRYWHSLILLVPSPLDIFAAFWIETISGGAKPPI